MIIFVLNRKLGVISLLPAFLLKGTLHDKRDFSDVIKITNKLAID